MAHVSAGNRLRRWAGLVGAVALSVMLTIPVLAANTVTQVINCAGPNNFSASITDLDLGQKNFSVTSQESTGNMLLSAAENGCLAQGWKVTLQASAWVKQDGGTPIPANAFALTSIPNPGYQSGQQIDPANGPKAVNELGTLDVSRKVLNANAGYGLGSYTQSLGVKLTIPGVTLPGTYKTTITTTMSTAP